MKRFRFHPKKSLRSQLFLTFIIPFVLVGFLVFGLVKYLSGSVIEEYVLPQFEQILQTNGEDLNRLIDSELVEEAIESPETNHAELISILNSFMEGKERLEYAYILTEQEDTGYIVGLNGSEDIMVESPLTSEQQNSLSNQEVVVTDIYEDEWGSHKSYFAPVAGTNAIVGVDMSTEFVNQLQTRVNLFLIAFLLVSTLIGGGLAYVYGTRLNRAISSLLYSVQEISQGDLTQRVSLKREDELGQLAQATDEMADSLKHLVESVSNSSNDVSAQSAQLTQASVEVKEGSAQVASTMIELSSGAESQANSSSELAEVMSGFVQKIKQASDSGSDVATASQTVLSMTENGRKLMENSVHQMSTIHHIVKESVDKVSGLDQQSKEISKLVKVIQDIAEQTNLLSLNAAIEAARAGEHGKGFAVVADEVRKLAEQVSASIVDITGIVNMIQSESGEVVETLKQGYQEVDEGSTQIETTGQTFADISHAVANMAGKIDRISGNLADIAQDSERMNASIEGIASVSEESAAGVQQVAASSQQTSSSMEEVSRSAEMLAELAQGLNEQVRQFKM
ncbi:methyl-accepting chemotaxis protein [Halobacillus fulvus]|nr:methyl-accepting chemotaxis protein [Halobacillus fulvus]